MRITKSGDSFSSSAGVPAAARRPLCRALLEVTGAAALGVAALALPFRPSTAGWAQDQNSKAPAATPGTDCAETIAFNRGMLAARPDELRLELRLARALSACGQYADAVAIYRQMLEADPANETVTREAGETLRRAGRASEAIPVLRRALQINPRDQTARLDLARALADRGSFAEALLRYDEVLEVVPDDYDALQGKAQTLYWTGRFAEARAIFAQLHRVNPADPDVNQQLQKTSQAHEEAYWTELRPAPEASPAEYLKYYEKRLVSYPKDHDAMKGVAYYKAELKDTEGAIRAYQDLLAVYPDDRDAKRDLARLMAQKQDYAGAIDIYQELLKDTPDDADLLASLAQVYAWSGHPRDALNTFRSLPVSEATEPESTSRRLEQARLHFQMKNYGAAREVVAGVLSVEPQNREAHLLLAQLDVKGGHWKRALRQFEQVLKQDPRDRDALYGKAQVEYYQGDARDAEVVAERLVRENSGDFDALMLLASIERARRNRRGAVELLDRAARLSPHNPEVDSLRENVEWPFTLRMAAGFAREIGEPGAMPAGGSSAREDLRTFAYGTTLEMPLLPRSESSFVLSYLPSNSPLGAIQGAAGPAQLGYRQATRISQQVTMRGGIGAVQFGPGTLEGIPSQIVPILSAGWRPTAFLGLNVALSPQLHFDLNWDRSGVTYTPLAVRLGVIQDRFDGAVTYSPWRSTQLTAGGFEARFDTAPYEHVTFANNKTLTGRIVQTKQDRDRAVGASFTFDWTAVKRRRFAFQMGYSALEYSYDGYKRNVYLGFFNPGFYQRHVLTSRYYGKLWGPLGYDFSGGIGVQQIEHGQALKRALIVSPAFTLKASPRLTWRLGYTHYNFGESLGVLTGNAIELTTDIKF